MSSKTLRFTYRYVPFSATFGDRPLTSANGTRPPEATGDERAYPFRDNLYFNEIVADAGHQCHPAFRTFDDRTGEFPCSAAAVLHHASEILQWSREVRERGFDSITLTTHRDPDFDAFCSLYLIRQIIEEEIPRDGYNAEDWALPEIEVGDRRAWPILLAAYAARLNRGERIDAPLARRLHSVIQARYVLRLIAPPRSGMDDYGTYELFEIARAGCEDGRRNPLVDNLFVKHSPEREISLLDREQDRYARDIARARKALVNLQSCDFDSWFPELTDVPLLDCTGRKTIDPVHLFPHPSGGERPLSKEVDGVYIVNPESVLFREWARTDFENSPSRRGFLFTAIVRSNPYRRRRSNSAPSYDLHLDSERADHLHLYPVWARLQEAEMAIRRTKCDAATDRPDFKGRRVGENPWYDGNSYRATTVASPDAGSAIADPKAGWSSDLSDDPVLRIVIRELEYGFFGPPDGHEPDQIGCETPVKIQDFEYGANPTADSTARIADAPNTEVKRDSFRLASVPLRTSHLTNSLVARAVGERLWPLLEPKGISAIPADFDDRHMVVRPHYVAVWNRNGIAIGYRPGAKDLVTEWSDLLDRLAWAIGALLSIAGNSSAEGAHEMEKPGDEVEERHGNKFLAGLSGRMKRLASALATDTPRTSRAATAHQIEQRVTEVEKLQDRVFALRVEAARPDNLPFRRLLESRTVADLLDAARVVYQGALQKQTMRVEEHYKFLLELAAVTGLGLAFVGLLLGWGSAAQSMSILTSNSDWVLGLGLCILIVVALPLWYSLLRKCRWTLDSHPVRFAVSLLVLTILEVALIGFLGSTVGVTGATGATSTTPGAAQSSGETVGQPLDSMENQPATLQN